MYHFQFIPIFCYKNLLASFFWQGVMHVTWHQLMGCLVLVVILCCWDMNFLLYLHCCCRCVIWINIYLSLKILHLNILLWRLSQLQFRCCLVHYLVFNNLIFFCGWCVPQNVNWKIVALARSPCDCWMEWGISMTRPSRLCPRHPIIRWCSSGFLFLCFPSIWSWFL